MMNRKQDEEVQEGSNRNSVTKATFVVRYDRPAPLPAMEYTFVCWYTRHCIQFTLVISELQFTIAWIVMLDDAAMRPCHDEVRPSNGNRGEVVDANMSMSTRVLQIRDDASGESVYQPVTGFQRVKHDVIVHGSEVL